MKQMMTMMMMMMMSTMQSSNPPRNASLNPIFAQMMATWNNPTPSTTTMVHIQSPSGETAHDTDDEQLKNIESQRLKWIIIYFSFLR